MTRTLPDDPKRWTTTSTCEPIDDDLMAAAYILLIDQPGLDLDEFANRLGCDKQAVQAILGRFTDLALLHRAHDDLRELVPASPIAAMQHLIAREQTLLRERQQFLQQSANTFASILSSYGGSPDLGGGDDLVEQLPELSAVGRRLQELSMSAKQQVLSFSPCAISPPAVGEDQRPVQVEALARGVRMRMLCLESVVMDRDAMTYASELTQAGTEIRQVSHLPMQMVIVDDWSAVVPRNPADIREGAYVFRQEAVVVGLRALFDAYWRQSRPLTLDDPRPWCNPAEMAVVRLLATGAKDDAVARQVGASVRTVRRIVADLMARSAVNSRFALGVHAAVNGWL